MTGDKIITKLKEKYGDKGSLTLDSDFTELPDEVLANAHLYRLLDKASIQANVEMSRRLKDSIKRMNDSSEKYSKSLVLLSVVLLMIALLQLIVTILPPNGWIKLIWLGMITTMVVFILRFQYRSKTEL